MYREAVSKLVSLGYDEDLALESVLKNGRCIGSIDALANVLRNAAGCIDGPGPRDRSTDRMDFECSNLRELVENSVDGMVCLLQQASPQLSRGNAIRCLLASLHLGRVSAVDGGGGGAGAEEGLKSAVRTAFAGISGNGKTVELPSGGEAAESQLGNRLLNGAGEDCNNVDVNGVAGRLADMSIDEKADGSVDEGKEVVSNLKQRVVELHGQLEEWKEWAQKKVIQAAVKLSHDQRALMMLRMERDETLRGRMCKQTLEDLTMKRLSEMESALRRASSQVDRENATARRFEAENAEIKAEMEAFKLSAAKSAENVFEITKREKKCLKKLLAWEEQKVTKVAEEKKKVSQFQKQLQLVKEAQNGAQIKWWQEVKAKELAMTLLEEKQRSKKAAEANVKSREENLRQKIDMDSHRYEDDIQRLQQELSRLKSSALSIQPKCPPNVIGREPDNSGMVGRTHLRTLQDTQRLLEPSEKGAWHDQECLVCMTNEVSVVFLPCAHQVICAGCNAEHEKAAKNKCSCCNNKIEERIRVFGTAS